MTVVTVCRKTVVLWAAVGLLALGCSASPPQIVSVEARLEHVHDFSIDRRYEQLTVFALVRDEDGFADIDAFYLLHDDSELFWRLDQDSWTHERRSGEDWIGFAGISMADGSELPRGLYRLAILDASGESDERRVLVDAPSVAELGGRFPLVSGDGRIITIQSGHALFRVVSTVNDDATAADRSLPAGEYRVEQLLADSNDSVGFVYVVLDDYSGILSGPFRR